MSDLYIKQNNKAKPAVILSYSETAKPEPLASVDWRNYKLPNYIMRHMVSNNDDPQCIVPFYMTYGYNTYSVPYDMIYTTNGGGAGVKYYANDNRIINFSAYKQVLNAEHAFSGHFTQAQRDRNWSAWCCDDTINTYGPNGDGSIGYTQGFIHFLDYSSSNVKFISKTYNVKTNIDIVPRPNGVGAAIDVKTNNISNGFMLGFNGIISAEGLSNYFNTIASKSPGAQWMGIGIKGGCTESDAYNRINSTYIKLYALNENTTNATALNNLLVKRELKTDVWYIEDKNFKTYNVTSTDSTTVNYFIKRTNGDNVLYFDGFDAQESEQWVTDKNDAKFYRTWSDANADYSRIINPGHGVVTVIDNSDSYEAINISQPLILTGNNLSMEPPTNYGFIVTGKRNNTNIVYSGNTATYESDKWATLNNETDGSYFKLANDAGNIVNQIAGSVSTVGVYKIHTYGEFSEMLSIPSNTMFTSLNYYIKPL